MRNLKLLNIAIAIRKMGAGASSELQSRLAVATEDQLKIYVNELAADTATKLRQAVGGGPSILAMPAAAAVPLTAETEDRYSGKNSVYWRERGRHHVKIENEPAAIEAALDKAAAAIWEADAILFVTGAGMGVDMGLSDFRSSARFWEELAHPDIKRYEDASDSDWFEKDPALAWGLNYVQLDSYRTAAPHEGYKVMHHLAELKKSDAHFCWTSNVDGCFQRVFGSCDRVNEVSTHTSIEPSPLTDALP